MKVKTYLLWSGTAVMRLMLVLTASSLMVSCYGAQLPDFVSGPLAKRLGENMDQYIGKQLTAHWLYNGPLHRQFQDVFTMVPDHPTQPLGQDLYLTTGFRYQEATSLGAMVVSNSAHIYLAAMAEAATYWHGKLLGSPAQLRILVRDPKNLRYLPAIEHWADAQPDMRGYVLTLYNLNCKERDIGQCKMPIPAGTISPAGAALAAH